ITRNHNVEQPYLEAVIRELELYIAIFKSRPLIREIHLGGGTPTFFSPENLSSLMSNIKSRCDIHESAEFSFEGHPNNTTYEHLSALYQNGFRRVSYGIQDLNEVVQKAINRIQPYENVERVTRWARDIGYESVNFDFVYGLPFQNSKNLAITLQTALELHPDRIAFYSYAHVPWTSKGQRAYDENDLPSPLEKANMYLMGRKMFRDRNYVDIGMDHFALPDDSLTLAMNQGRLHRNFMGYTVAPSQFLLGLGCSSISDAISAYSQNEKTVERYISTVANGELPLTKGHFLSMQEQAIRMKILSIACKRESELNSLTPQQLNQLQEMSDDDVCAVFDPRLEANTQNTYSKAV
ncbi:MAG: radical SAM protein, partial [Cyclobacteriaceae bacterium]